MFDEQILKNKIVAHCIHLKEDSEASTLAAINDAQLSANEYGAPKDRYDSFRAQLMRKRDMLAQQLAVIEEELRFLRQFKTGISKKAELGAMVVLESQTLFILTGTGKIEIDGKIIYVVSPVVPLVTAMNGKKKGETFVFRGAEMKIIDLF